MPSAKSSWSIPRTTRLRQVNRANSPFAGRRCSPAIGRRTRPTRAISAAAGSIWVTFSGATRMARSISSIAPNIMIKTGGENVYPAEIERVLLSDTRITEAAVVRAPDAKWGEVPVAFVSCRDGSVTEAELAAMCRRDLAGYKRPRQFRFHRVRGISALDQRQGATSRTRSSPRPGARMSRDSAARQGRDHRHRPYRRSARCRGAVRCGSRPTPRERRSRTPGWRNPPSTACCPVTPSRRLFIASASRSANISASSRHSPTISRFPARPPRPCSISAPPRSTAGSPKSCWSSPPTA